MGLEIINPLIKTVAKKAPYVAPKMEVRTLESLGLKMEQLTGDVFEKPLKQKIKPCCLGKAEPPKIIENELNWIYHVKGENKEVPKIYDYIWNKFYESVNPRTLVEHSGSIKESTHLTNFDKLDGSLAVSSGFDGSVLSTDGLFQCAGLAVVDKKQRIQSLVHCFAYDSIPDMNKMLKYILKHSNPQDLEISLIPGCRARTASTVSGIDDLIKQIYPKVKINYMNFPAGAERTRNTAIILQNGELSFCNTELIQNKKINPIDKIIYFES